MTNTETAVEVFNFQGSEVRTIMIDEAPWFVGKDVADQLGYTNASKALKDHVDDEDKKLNNKTLLSFGQRGATLINEYGIYSLVMSSKLPLAKKFKRWVISEVLPAIRKTGKYEVKPDSYMIENRAERARRWAEEEDARIALADKNKELEIETVALTDKVTQMEPKVSYCDKILQSKGLTNITNIAKDYGMSGQKLNALLHDLGIQYKSGGSWVLYAKYQGRKWARSVTNTSQSGYAYSALKWSQVGRLAIYEKLRDNDILPVMEQEEAY